MSLQQIATDLKSKISNKQLALDNSIIKLDNFAFLLSYFNNNVINLTGLTDPDKQIAVQDNVLTITGGQSLYSLNINVTIKLTEQEDKSIQSDYNTSFTNISFSNLVNWNIIPTTVFDPSILPALPFDTVAMRISSEQTVQTWSATNSKNTMDLIGSIGLKLGGIGFALLRSPDPLTGGYDTSFALSGTFMLGKSNLSITAQVPVGISTPSGQWSVSLSSAATLADGISDLSQIAFGNNLFASLPPGFQDALSFSISKLLIVFSLNTKEVKYIQVSIERPADKPWAVVNGFTILNAGATFSLSKQTKGFSLSTFIFGKFLIGKAESSTKALLDVELSIPGGDNDWVARISGSIENIGFDTVFSSLPTNSGQPVPAFPVGLSLQQINLDYLIISFNPSSKTLTAIRFSVTSVLELNIFDLLKVQNPYAALDITNPSLSTQRTITGKVGGRLEVAGIPFDVLANKPAANIGWTFSAGMPAGTSISLLDLVKKFLQTLNITSLPDWLNKASLDISDVKLSVYIPTADATDQSKKYRVEGSVKWAINVNSFILPSLTATVAMDYVNGKSSGTIAVNAILLGLPFKVGYKFGTPDTAVYLEWLGIQADYKHDSVTQTDTISITFANMSLGAIITHLIASFEPGFTLPAPWNALNSINLSGLSLVFTQNKADSTKNKIVIAYTKKIDLTFIQIDKITLTKDNTGVFLGFEGKFLGITISSAAPNPDVQKLAGKGTDIRDMGGIPVPGMGSQYFDLEYLGLGQRVALYPFEDLKTVEQATDALKNVFKAPVKPAPGQPPILPIKPKPATKPVDRTLIFSEQSNWLIASRFTIIEAIKLGIIFNDPNLYGLLIQLNGDKMKVLNGLKFQILYKKVTDAVGVYQIELKLPDSVRELQFGAVSVTLPIIGIDIYTNGSFKLDFGFPYNMDFSRSLTVQAFPFTGSGGFYIAYLNNVPSDNVPKTAVGKFNPIIEFGLGLQLGIGKSINKGILSAGFSITVIGIFEGVIAFYTPNLSTYPGKGETYYKVSATVGIVGRLYGEINFAIISASLDVRVYAYVQMVVEAYRKIPIYLEAGVSVSLRVSINLGLFKIHINLHFSTTISASFTIGSDSTAPWDLPAPKDGKLIQPAAAASLQSGALYETISLKWQPLVLTDTEKAEEKIALYFFPQLTMAASGSAQAVQFANVLYIDAPEDGSTTDASLNRLVKGVLYWCINAAINSDQSGTTLDNLKTETVSKDILKQVHAYLSDTQTNPSPIAYTDIEQFLKAYFTINLMDPDHAVAKSASANGLTVNASIFPMFPLLQLSWKLGDTTTKLSTYNVDSTYMGAVQDELKKLQVNYRNQLEKEADETSQKAHGVADTAAAAPGNASQPMPAFVFQDYILMVAKAALQDVIDEFDKLTYPSGSLNNIVTYFNSLTYTKPGKDPVKNTLTPDLIANANSTVLFNKDVPLKIPGISYQVKHGDTLKIIADLYGITAVQLNNDNNNNIQGLVAEGTVVQITGFNDYTVAAGQTMVQIASGIIPKSGSDQATIEQVLQAIVTQPVLLNLAKLTLPDLAYTTKSDDTFEKLATFYGVTIALIANEPSNAQQDHLFAAASLSIPALKVLNVQKMADTFDTTDNIARISGMAARYFLHGMRLPVPNDMNNVAALYTLTGQQLGLPALKTGDKLSIQLTKTSDTGDKCWLQLNNSCTVNSLDINITDNTISRIQDLSTITLNPDTTPLPPQAMPLGRQTAETFTLKPGFAWQYPGKLALPIGTPPVQLSSQPSIWGFSDTLMSRLSPVIQKAPDLGLEVVKLVRESSEGSFKQQDINYAFATIMEVSIQEIPSADGNQSEHTYEVIGANDTSIVLLERLIQYINLAGSDDFIQQVQVLYPPDNTGNTPAGMQSAANGDITLALVQANLSTETNPTVFGNSKSLLLREEPRNTLNTFKQFISFLWQCSIIRTGGYYLYYKTGNGDGLPATIFSKGRTAKISMLITYKNSLSLNFVNSVVIADTIDQSDTTVYVKADKLSTLVAQATPGNAGFRLERKKPDDYVPLEPYPIPATPESKIQDTNYLDYQFNLIGYRIIENEVFGGVSSLLPVGPIHEPDPKQITRLKALPDKALAEENWKYSSIIPLAKNVKDAKRIQPLKSTYPPAAGDPYAGIGNTVQVRLNWQDMFGNTINTALSDGTHDITLSNLYTDNLYTLAQWPSVTAYYSFPVEGGKPQLTTDLIFDTTRYTVSSKITKEDVINNARIDLVTYQKIYYQLIQQDIRISLESSINSDTTQYEFPVNAGTFSGFAGDIWAYLDAVSVNPMGATPPANISLKNPVTLNNSSRIFELTVVLTIKRTAHIDPGFAAVLPVSIATTTLRPVTKASPAVAGDAGDVNSLTAFAAEFEATFKDMPAAGNFLKIATGLDRLDNDTSSNKIWVVHFDANGQNGLYYTIEKSQQYFYAPVPLANNLETYDKVSICNYKSGEPYPYSTPQLKTFSDIDLDNWGKGCLEAIDSFLTAEYATPAFLIDNGASLQQVLDAKELIAEGISGNVDIIIEPDAPDESSRQQASEKLKQQVLIQLSNAYKINTIVQNVVTVKHGFTGSNQPVAQAPFVPQLYGVMSGTLTDTVKAVHAVIGDNEDISEEYTLSTAKVPLGDGKSYLTYLFEAKEADKHSSFNFSDMLFKISYIEHQIDTVSNMGAYRASSWLTLIIPLETSMAEAGPVQIPIALRSYPTPPSLTNQQIDYTPSGGPDKTTSLNDVVLWGYDFSYLPPKAGQDQIHATLQFNNNTQGKLRNKYFQDENGNYDPALLPATLAQFISVYPDIKKDFVNVLLKSPHDPVAAKAVTAFATLINNVGVAWKKWKQVKDSYKLMQQNELPAITYDYDVIESPSGSSSDARLMIKVLPKDTAPAIAMNLPEYTPDEEGNGTFYKMVNGKKVYLLYNDRTTVPIRNLSIGGLNVLEVQNAWSGVLLTRNEDLVKNPDGSYKKTNDAFIYKTPLVRFYNELIPLLVCNESIYIAEIANPGKPQHLNLARHLQNLFKTLLSNINNLDQMIKVECLYQYNLQGTDAFNQITLPVLLATPTLFKLATDWNIGTEGDYCKDSGSFTCNVTTTILGWFKDNNPLLNNGILKFVIELYDVGDNKLPILKLNDLFLPVTYITELKP
jgi:LysM repeat protein